MLKQTVEYVDFDDNQAIETLYFNLTKSELADNLHLEQELREIQKITEGDKRSVTGEEIKKILNLVKTFMQLSYGVRSSDGKRFVKTDEQWAEFTQTAAYDAFLYSLFEQPEKSIEFMSGILPLDLRDRARAAAQSELKKVSAPEEVVKPEVDTVPAIRSDISDTTVPIAQPEPKAPSEEDIRAYLAKNPTSGQSYLK